MPKLTYATWIKKIEVPNRLLQRLIEAYHRQQQEIDELRAKLLAYEEVGRPGGGNERREAA